METETTSELSIVISEKFQTQDAAFLRARIGEHLTVGEPRFLFRKSADPSLTSILQILGDAAAWLPLRISATVFLSTIAKRAADATWDSLAALLKSKEVKPLSDVTNSLATVSNMVDGNVEVLIGLNIPDDHSGTAMLIETNSTVEVAYMLAQFVVHADQLAKAMQLEIEKGDVPLGPAKIQLQDDGSLLVKWRSQSDLKNHEVVINPKGSQQ